MSVSSQPDQVCGVARYWFMSPSLRFRLQIPRNRVKYVVGPGGVKIQEIQRRSKARIQVLKVGCASLLFFLGFW
jgi:hypothetical protein